MLHVVPEGYEFFHKGVTEATVNKAKQIWIKHGNMKKEDCVVLLGAKNLLQRMETYWETFLHAHPDADICDVVQRMLMSNLYEIDMTDFCRDVSKTPTSRGIKFSYHLYLGLPVLDCPTVRVRYRTFCKESLLYEYLYFLKFC